MGGFIHRFGQSVSNKGFDDPAHAATIFFDEFEFFKNGGNLFIAQVRFVVARFDHVNGQIVEQRARVKKFDAVVKYLDGGVVGATIVAMHDHVDYDFSQCVHGVVPAFFAARVAGDDVGFVGVLDDVAHDAFDLVDERVGKRRQCFDHFFLEAVFEFNARTFALPNDFQQPFGCMAGR